MHPELLQRPHLVVATKRDAVAEHDPLPALRAAAWPVDSRSFPSPRSRERVCST